MRTAETNLGNLLCDVMLASLQADCALLNAGTVRSNTKHSKGEFKLRVSVKLLALQLLTRTNNCPFPSNQGLGGNIEE